jgi:hypothetical protein
LKAFNNAIHLALTGIIAALLNGFGVAGVAPQVTVYVILVCPGG